MSTKRSTSTATSRKPAKRSVPARPAAKPAPRAGSKAAPKRAAKPAPKRAAKPASKPASKPAAKRAVSKRATPAAAKVSSRATASPARPAAKAGTPAKGAGQQVAGGLRIAVARPPARLQETGSRGQDRPRASTGSPRHEPDYDAGVDEGLNPGFFPIDEVMDETDQAQHLQLQEQASISSRARLLNRPEFHPDFDGETCVECGDDMPPARLKLNKVRCVECQSALEAASALARRTYG